jgi:hypothetical protein
VNESPERSRRTTGTVATRPGFWFAAAVVVGTVIRVPHLFFPATGPYSFRLAQTAMGVREFARHGVDLTASPLPVFGVADNVPFEFPLFQALARELMRLGADATAATRLAGLLGFQVVAVLWFVLLCRWVGARTAAGAVVLLEFLPFGLLWGDAPLIDFFSVALGLGMVVALDSWMRGRGWPFLAAGAILASLLFLVKVTSVPASGVLLLTSVALVVVERGRRATWPRILAALALGPGLALVPLLLWTRHADGVKAASTATQFLTSDALVQWNFGTWEQRTSAATWQDLAHRVSGEISGFGLVSLALALVLGVVFGSLRQRVALAGLVVGALAPVLIFFNLYAVHAYYLTAVYPMLCAIPVVGVAALAERFDRPRITLAAAGVMALLVLSTAVSPQGRADIHLLRHRTPVAALSERLRQVTPPGSRIVLVGCDWNPEFLYEADRTGLMFRQQTPAQAWAENDVRDYGFIAQCNDEIDPAKFLPPGYGLGPTAAPEVFRIVRGPA